jgi:hypothetical protein
MIATPWPASRARLSFSAVSISCPFCPAKRGRAASSGCRPGSGANPATSRSARDYLAQAIGDDAVSVEIVPRLEGAGVSVEVMRQFADAAARFYG